LLKSESALSLGRIYSVTLSFVSGKNVELELFDDTKNLVVLIEDELVFASKVIFIEGVDVGAKLTLTLLVVG
jgi:DNA topoisomerase IA